MCIYLDLSLSFYLSLFLNFPPLSNLLVYTSLSIQICLLLFKFYLDTLTHLGLFLLM